MYEFVQILCIGEFKIVMMMIAIISYFTPKILCN